MKALLLAASLLAAPAATAQDLEAQYGHAYETFIGLNDDSPEALFELSETIMEGAVGVWLYADLLAPTTPNPDFDRVPRGCERLSVEIERSGPFSIRLSRVTEGPDTPMRFDLVFGRTFNLVIDPEDALSFLGPNLSDSPLSTQQSLLQYRASGTVQIYAPSPDILVILDEGKIPTILVRCPS